MIRRFALLALFAMVLILGSRSSALAYPCQNNPGCYCFNATYSGGDDCRICSTCGDCLVVIC